MILRGEPSLAPPDDPPPDYRRQVRDIEAEIIRLMDSRGAVLYADAGRVMLTVCDEDRGDPIVDIAVQIRQ